MPISAIYAADEHQIFGGNQSTAPTNVDNAVFPFNTASSLTLAEQDNVLYLQGWIDAYVASSIFVNSTGSVQNMTLSISNEADMIVYPFSNTDIQSLMVATAEKPYTIQLSLVPLLGKSHKIVMTFVKIDDNKPYPFVMPAWTPLKVPGIPTVTYKALGQTSVNLNVSLNSFTGGADVAVSGIQVEYGAKDTDITSTYYPISQLINDKKLNQDGSYTISLTGLTNQKLYRYNIAVVNGAGFSPFAKGTFTPTDTPNAPDINSVSVNDTSKTMVVNFTPNSASFVTDFNTIGVKFVFTNPTHVEKSFTAYGSYTANDSFSYSTSEPTGSGFKVPLKNMVSYNVAVPQYLFEVSDTYTLQAALINQNGLGTLCTAVAGILVIGTPGQIPSATLTYNNIEQPYNAAYVGALASIYGYGYDGATNSAAAFAYADAYASAYVASLVTSGSITSANCDTAGNAGTTAVAATVSGTANALQTAVSLDNNNKRTAANVYAAKFAKDILFTKVLSRAAAADNAGTAALASNGTFSTSQAKAKAIDPLVLAQGLAAKDGSAATLKAITNTYANLANKLRTQTGTLVVEAPKSNWSTGIGGVESIVQKRSKLDASSVEGVIADIVYNNYQASVGASALSRAIFLPPVMNLYNISTVDVNVDTVSQATAKFDKLSVAASELPSTSSQDGFGLLKQVVYAIITMKAADLSDNGSKFPALGSSTDKIFVAIEDQFDGITGTTDLVAKITDSTNGSNTTAESANTIVPIYWFNQNVPPTMTTTPALTIENKNVDIVIGKTATVLQTYGWVCNKITADVYTTTGGTTFSSSANTKLTTVELPVPKGIYGRWDTASGISLKALGVQIIEGLNYNAQLTYEFVAPNDRSIKYTYTPAVAAENVTAAGIPAPFIINTPSPANTLVTDTDTKAVFTSDSYPQAGALIGNSLTSIDVTCVPISLLTLDSTNTYPVNNSTAIQSLVSANIGGIKTLSFSAGQLTTSAITGGTGPGSISYGPLGSWTWQQTGLAFNTKYFVYTKVTGTPNSSEWTLVKDFTTKIGKPNAPTSPALTLRNSQLIASWTAPSTTGAGSSPVATYTLTLSDSTGIVKTVTIPGSILSYAFEATDGLKIGTSYTLQVSAASSAFSGPISTASSATTYAVPVGVNPPVISADRTSITVSFTLNSSTISNLILFYDIVGSSGVYQVPAGKLSTLTSTSNSLVLTATDLGLIGAQIQSGLFVGTDSTNAMFYAST